MDLCRDAGGIIHAVQDDRYSRNLELTLFSSGAPWNIPEGITLLVRYSKPDGRGGEYSTMPDGSSAWSAEGNVLTIALAPQVLTVPGAVNLSVTIMKDHMQISTFSLLVSVSPAVNGGIGESEVYFHVPGFLPAPASAEEGQYLRISGVDSAGHITRMEAVTPAGQKFCTEPEEGDIPRVFFGNSLPQTKDDTVMSFRYTSKTRDIRGWCKTKAQGNSSMSYPKKNQTVKLYADEACQEKLNIDFRGWGAQNTFCFKANWEDLTHARNVVSARLWGDVVKSRENYGEMPALMKASPNHGAVDGFPVKVYAGGIYQGRYTLNIPKAAWMSGMDKTKEEHCILCGENYESGCFRAPAVIDGSDWSDEIHETVPEAVRIRWNEVIRFVMDSSDEVFVSDLGNYFNVESLVDYYLMGLIICNNDGFGKNQLYHTYDGRIWYAGLYDLDNTFGSYLGSMLTYHFPRSSYEDYRHGGGNLLYLRLEKLFAETIRQRYAQLKEGALSISSIINRFEAFMEPMSAELAAEDYAATTAGGAFTQIPLKQESNIQQIRDYIVKRYPYVDDYIDSLGKESALLYQLPGETTFQINDEDIVATDVKLFDEPKDFTVFIDLTSMDAPKHSIILSADVDAAQYEGGFGFRTYAYEGDGYDTRGVVNQGAERLFPEMLFPNERAKFAFVFTKGLPASAAYCKASDQAIVFLAPKAEALETTPQHNKALIIGSDEYGNHRWSGIIHSLEIYNKAMTAEELTQLLSR